MYSVYFNGSVLPEHNLPDRLTVARFVRQHWDGSHDGCPVCVKIGNVEVASINGRGQIGWID